MSAQWDTIAAADRAAVESAHHPTITSTNGIAVQPTDLAAKQAAVGPAVDRAICATVERAEFATFK
jgi:hypothetical protein